MGACHGRLVERIMSKRCALPGLVLTLLGTTVAAETPEQPGYADAQDRVVPFGESGWELFRPVRREQAIFDLAYMTDDLRSEYAGLGLRFHSSTHLTFDVQLDPFTHAGDLVGPVYGSNIGATVLAVHLSF